MNRRPSRRLFLGGAGAVIGLPFLEALAPRRARAQPRRPARLLFYYVPNGMHMPGWRPATPGDAYALPPILMPLAALRNDVSVLSGLQNLPARPDGPGDHASGTGAFLTCAHPKKTEGADIQNGVSVDQVAASAIGMQSRFPSLQLGTEGGSSAGGCDSGYSCAYARNISWAGPATPLPKLTNAQTVFDRLFEGMDATQNAAEQAKRRKYRKSVIDYALDDAGRLRAHLGTTDRRKVDEYLGGVRDLERRLQQAAAGGSCTPSQRPAAPNAPITEQVKVMSDLMVLALQCEATRIVSFMLGNAGSGQNYSFLGVEGGHHQISHHQMNPIAQASLQTIGTWEVTQFAYLLAKMKAIDEGGASLLDNTAVFFSSEISDGDRHNHDDLPVLLAGRGGGAFTPGRHVVYDKQPLANLFLSMLGAVGVKPQSFGDGTGPLASL